MRTPPEQLHHERLLYAQHQLGMTERQAEAFADLELHGQEKELEAIELGLEDANDQLEALHRQIAEIHEALLSTKMNLIADRFDANRR